MSSGACCWGWSTRHPHLPCFCRGQSEQTRAVLHGACLGGVLWACSHCRRSLRRPRLGIVWSKTHWLHSQGQSGPRHGLFSAIDLLLLDLSTCPAHSGTISAAWMLNYSEKEGNRMGCGKESLIKTSPCAWAQCTEDLSSAGAEPCPVSYL